MQASNLGRESYGLDLDLGQCTVLFPTLKAGDIHPGTATAVYLDCGHYGFAAFD